MDWDDLRFVLAVKRAGSALAAAGVLSVNQTTIMRRISQLETSLGVDLFERRPTGFVATEHGEAVAKAAARMETEVQCLEHYIATVHRKLTGTVRATASESMANRLMSPCLREFRQLYPDIRIELITDDRRLNVSRGEADVALRAGSRPEGAGIVARRLPDCAWAAYCGDCYAAENGVPKSTDDLARHAIIGMEGRMADLAAPRWLAAATPDVDVRVRSSSLTNLISNLRAGLGVAMLPCIVGDAEAGLVRCFEPVPELDSELWLVVREEVRDTPHVRAFADFLAAFVNGLRPHLSGRSLS